MSTIKSSAENLTLNADGANNDIIFQSNGSNVATLDQAGLLTATTFAGSGASLTALPAAQVSGTHTSFTSTGIDDNATAVKLTVSDDGININGNITSTGAGQGIYLGVAGAVAANLLDDYEEGTWTGTITVGGSDNLEGTYDSTYTKIGRQVTVHYAAQLTNTTNGTGHLWVSGLPFTKTGGDGDFLLGCNDRMNVTSAVLRVADGQSIAKAYKLPTSTSANLTNFDNADMGNTGKWIYFCLTYYV